jgi:hypothetical protein
MAWFVDVAAFRRLGCLCLWFVVVNRETVPTGSRRCLLS